MLCRQQRRQFASRFLHCNRELCIHTTTATYVVMTRQHVVEETQLISQAGIQVLHPCIVHGLV